MAVTVQEVAKRAGVSPMTVSRVVGSPRVSPEARQRVEQAVAEFGYVPTRLARGLLKGKVGVFSLVVLDITNLSIRCSSAEWRRSSLGQAAT